MTTKRQPTPRDTRALVDFLPKLYGDGTPPPITRWSTRTQDRALTLPWPDYDETVEGFIDLIGADPAEGDRSERRNHPDARGLLPQIPQSSRTRELGRCDASPLGERRHATRPGDQPRRSSMDPGTAYPNGVALARYQPDSALSKWFNERTAGSRGRIRRVDDRGVRPQAAHRALAVLRDRSRADWRQARLIARPRCSRPAGRGRGWAGWRVAEALAG